MTLLTSMQVMQLNLNVARRVVASPWPKWWMVGDRFVGEIT